MIFLIRPSLSFKVLIQITIGNTFLLTSFSWFLLFEIINAWSLCILAHGFSFVKIVSCMEELSPQENDRYRVGTETVKLFPAISLVCVFRMAGLTIPHVRMKFKAKTENKVRERDHHYAQYDHSPCHKRLELGNSYMNTLNLQFGLKCYPILHTSMNEGVVYITGLWGSRKTIAPTSKWP